MPAAGAAALAPLGQGHRGEDEEPGVGIEVAGFAGGDRPVVRLLHPAPVTPSAARRWRRGRPATRRSPNDASTSASTPSPASSGGTSVTSSITLSWRSWSRRHDPSALRTNVVMSRTCGRAKGLEARDDRPVVADAHLLRAGRPAPPPLEILEVGREDPPGRNAACEGEQRPVAPRPRRAGSRADGRCQTMASASGTGSSGNVNRANASAPGAVARASSSIAGDASVASTR